ncbi:MAG: RNA polymerase factor sigma-54 [Lentisphaeria bacterium]|jgi:RNA polymerase sigma-54 factor
MPMELSHSQIQTLRQELVPAQIQSLEILQTPVLELEQKLNEILAKNPALELVESGSEQLAGLPTETPGELPTPPAAPEPEPEPGPAAAPSAAVETPADEGHDDWLADAAAPEGQARDLEEAWRDYLPAESTGHAHPSEEEEERRQFRFDSLTAPASLLDSLEEQLRQTDGLAPDVRAAAEETLGSLDATGYLRSSLEDIALACAVPLATAEKALALVQQFDPPGVGARDLRECLLLQLERQGRHQTPVYAAVSRHLDALGKNQIPQVAKAMGLSPNRVYDLLAEIRQLRPYPMPERDRTAAGVADAQTFIVPEIRVFRKADGQWTVESNREFTPRLRLSPTYLRMAQREDLDAEARRYIRAKLAEGKLLLRALDHRQSTLERITWRLLEEQRDFFEHGPGMLHPLTIAHLAQSLGLHETTVGRAVAGKYLETPHGILPFRQFFSAGGIATGDGEKLSILAVKQKILELIHPENHAHPLRDEQIVQELAAAGLAIARRTVAKYREELGIQPSHLRRTHRT